MVRMELGNLSNVKWIGGGLGEYRIDWGPGYRLYLTQDGDELIILFMGGTKKRQQSDIRQAGALLEAGNYVLTQPTLNGDITAVQLTITADAKSKISGDTDPALTYVLTTGAFVGTDSLTGALSRDPGESAGTYAIIQGTLDAGPNYAITYVGALLTVTAANTTVLAAATPESVIGVEGTSPFPVPRPARPASRSVLMIAAPASSLHTSRSA